MVIASKAVSDQFWSLLAGLRFFFAFWVLSDHTYNFTTVDRAIPVLSKSGLAAVLCFLVISGFSIAHSLEVKREGFYGRRFRRVFPVNLAALAMLAGGLLLNGKLVSQGTEFSSPDWSMWVTHLLLIQALIPPIMPILFPSWSLSIEVMYYAIAPLLARVRTAVLLAFLFVSCAFFVGWTISPNLYIAQAPYGYAVVSFAFAWFIGWLAFKMPGSWFLCAIGIVLGVLVISIDTYGFQSADLKSRLWNYTAWSGMMIIICFRPSLRFSGAQMRILTYLGDISFPLYMIHYPVLFLASTFIWQQHPETNYGVVHLAISMMAADLVLRITDRKYWPTFSRPIALDQTK